MTTTMAMTTMMIVVVVVMMTMMMVVIMMMTTIPLTTIVTVVVFDVVWCRVGHCWWSRQAAVAKMTEEVQHTPPPTPTPPLPSYPHRDHSFFTSHPGKKRKNEPVPAWYGTKSGGWSGVEWSGGIERFVTRDTVQNAVRSAPQGVEAVPLPLPTLQRAGLAVALHRAQEGPQATPESLHA